MIGDKFSLNFTGKISNLTLEKEDNVIKLSYANELLSEADIYEYMIIPPECNNLSLSINSFQSKKININDLFQIKTNTKYYIWFKNFPSNLLSVNINDEEVIYEEKIQLKNNENF